MGYASHGISPTIADTDQKEDLLAEGRNSKGVWVYVQASGAVAQYSAVKIDNDGQAAELTTAISGTEPTAVGIAQVALADNEYGWVWAGEGGGSGKGIKVTVLADCAAGAKIYTTTTAGSVDDTATDLIQGLTTLTTDGGSGSAVEVYSPIRLVTNAQDA